MEQDDVHQESGNVPVVDNALLIRVRVSVFEILLHLVKMNLPNECSPVLRELQVYRSWTSIRIRGAYL